MGLVEGRESFLIKSQVALEALFPGSFLVVGSGMGAAVVCSRSSSTKTREPGVGGFEPEDTVSVRVRHELLPGVSVELGVEVDLDGERYRVASVGSEAGDAVYLVELEVIE